MRRGGDAASFGVRAAAYGAGGRRATCSWSHPGVHPVLLDFFVEAPGRGFDPRARAELIPITVSFGDAIQVFNIGAASVGTYGMPAGMHAAAAAVRPRPAVRAGRPGRAPGQGGVEVNAQQAYVLEILADIVTATPECAALFAPEGRLLGAGDTSASPSSPMRSSGWAPRGRRPSTPATSPSGDGRVGVGPRRHADRARISRVLGGPDASRSASLPRTRTC